MNEQTAVVIGASGLIGNYLVEQLLHDEYFGTVRVLVRRGLAFDHPKLQQVIVNFNNINDYTKRFGKGDIIFCCVGTTQKKVKGDKVAYEKVDHDIPVNAAQIGIDNGFKKFLVVSSIGANLISGNFYLRLKGEMEKDIKQFPFKSISIFRPSMLLGKRNESRPGEKAGQIFMQAISFLFFGRFKKYHSVKAVDVAKAMIAQSKKDDPGIHIVEYPEMKKLFS
ncbi:MAG TPA: NAD(P)H-binding protein [Chitinophagaceae bacterium]